MLDEVDRGLRSLLSGFLPEGTTVSFEPPAEGWVAGNGNGPADSPVLDLFLFDIREDLGGRAADWDDVRDERGRMIGRQPPARRYELTYLVSAWAGSREQEHRLLGAVLRAAAPHERIPAECLDGALGERGLPLPLRVAMPAEGTRVQETWSALGTPARTALELLVVAPLISELDRDLAPPTERMQMGVARREGGEELPMAVFTIGGEEPEPEPEPAGAEEVPEKAAPRPVGRGRWRGVVIEERAPGSPSNPGR